MTNELELESLDTPEKRNTMKYGWLRDQWQDVQWIDEEGEEKRLWHKEEQGSYALRREASRFYKQQYESILEASGQ